MSSKFAVTSTSAPTTVLMTETIVALLALAS